jgi:hypothetical protein
MPSWRQNDRNSSAEHDKPVVMSRSRKITGLSLGKVELGLVMRPPSLTNVSLTEASERL